MNPAVVLPAGGGLGASTIPLTGGATEGVGRVLSGTEFVTGAVETVGEMLLGFPSTLFDGCGMLGGVEGTEAAFGAVAVAGAALAAGAEVCAWTGVGAAPGSGSSGSVSVAS